MIEDDDGGLQFAQEIQQWEEELEDEALNDYLIALFEYYGNREKESK